MLSHCSAASPAAMTMMQTHFITKHAVCAVALCIEKWRLDYYIVTSTKVKVMQSVLFVILSFWLCAALLQK